MSNKMLSTGAGVLATPATIGKGQRNLPMMTPRTNALYAANERQFNTNEVQFNTKNPAEMAKTYANVPVHRMASQLSFGSSILGGNGPNEKEENKNTH